MKKYYHCPKCYSNNTERAVLINSFKNILVEGKPYEPKLHGNPYKCNHCNNVFAVGIDKIPYIEHCKLSIEE